MTSFRPLTQAEILDIYQMLKMADEDVRGNNEPLFTAIEAMEEAILPEPLEGEAVDPAPFVLPTDFGGSQRFLLAERLYRRVTPEPAPSLFDRPTHIQQHWASVADEAIAALVEVPSA